jgi:hypothetical protein
MKSATIVAMVLFAVTALCTVPAEPVTAQSAQQQSQFPAVGHTYRVDFVSFDGKQKFLVELIFASETSMTYTGIRPDGSRGASETVTTELTPIAPAVFMVTWKESDKTTVVHVEDYGNMVFYTNITDGSDAHDFSKFKGAVTLIK